MNKFADGDATIYAFERILEIDTELSNDELPEKNYMDSLDLITLFRDGINNRIVELGYPSADIDNIPQKLKFIKEQFKNNNIEPISDATLKNWLTTTTPSDDTSGRDKVFKLCFALEMDAVKKAEFCQKG